MALEVGEFAARKPFFFKDNEKVSQNIAIFVNLHHILISYNYFHAWYYIAKTISDVIITLNMHNLDRGYR